MTCIINGKPVSYEGPDMKLLPFLRDHLLLTGAKDGCSDDAIPWGREGDWMDTKYPYVCHAELNAILNANGNLKGCTLYVDLFPCNECAKAVIQAGISRVVYLSDKYKDSDSTKASKRMFDAAGVSYTHLEVAHKTITLDLAKE